MVVKYIIVNYSGEATAAINRCTSLVKGMKEYGVESNINVLKIKSSLRFVFVLHYFFSMIRYLVFENRSNILILYGYFPFLNLLKLIKRKDQVIIAERNEYPSCVLEGDVKTNDVYLKNMSMFNGFVTCTQNLKSFYGEYIGLKKLNLIIPSVVITAKFYMSSRKLRKKYITYCGDIGNNKDGVPDLIKAFSIFSKQYDNYKLRIIGDTKDVEGKKEILDLIERLNLKENVIMEGRVPYTRIPEMLNESELLVLARPSNKQAEGGFPSKVSEYLSTGLPTLVTETGELNKYFTHNESIFFSPPGNYIEFAKLMIQIISNYDFSTQVANRGRELNNFFDFKKQGFVLKEYIERVIENKY